LLNNRPSKWGKGGAMFKNIIPIKKYDRYPLSLASITSQGEIVEKEPVGFAFLKPGAKTFRLKVWAFPNNNYFLARDEEKGVSHYQVLALEEYQTASGELKSNWNIVGSGELIGNFIKIKIQFFSDEIFLCLFPLKSEAKEDVIAI
jgi:hypothetical protein